MEQATHKVRQSNIELLRIISIFMIILHHLSLHTEWHDAVFETITPQYLWIRFILMGGKLGVNIFVLISGYFLSLKKEGYCKRAFELWRTILFYSLGCYGLGLLLGTVRFSGFEILKSFCPVTTVHWWFATTYFILFILAPFINILIEKIDIKVYRRMLIIMFVIWSILPTVTNYTLEGGNITWFMFLYLVGGYIRKYGLLCEIKTHKIWVLAIAAILIAFILATVSDYNHITERVFGVVNHNYFYEMNHVTTCVSSVLIFLCFLRLNINTSRIINLISPATFGIYLLHDNQCIQHYLWNDIICAMKYENSLILIPYTIFAAVAVFMVCYLIETVRKNTIERIIQRII